MKITTTDSEERSSSTSMAARSGTIPDHIRVLFVGLSNHGHIYPLMPLALACHDTGNEVFIATGKEFLPLIRSIGFTVHQVGASISWGWQEAMRVNPELSAEDEQHVAPIAAEVLAEKVVRELLPVLEEIRPDVVVYEPYCPGAALAARLTGTPTASYIQGRALPKMMQEEITPRLEELWCHYGGESPLPSWWMDNFLDSWPQSLQDSPPIVSLDHRYPIRPVGWSDPATHVPEWITLPRDRPLVYLAFSTVFGLTADVLKVATSGLATLDVDVLVVAGPQNDPAVLKNLPDRIHIDRFVAQAEVLPYADVVVSHGGSGTFLGALASGLPQLLMPYGADQFANADQLARSGAGLRLLPDQATSHMIADGVRTLLHEPSYRVAAHMISRDIAAMPSPEELVTVLRGLAASDVHHTPLESPPH